MRYLFLRPVAHPPSTFRPYVRSISSNHQVFAENDIVLLRHTRDPEKVYLTPPLHPDKRWSSHYGILDHSEIIGKPVRQLLYTHTKNVSFRASFPTLDEYIVNVRRMVTPIYPLDAATIVTLLDLHVMQPTPGSKPVEVFEAGTGHGSLTLALCKALYAGNSHLPVPLPEDQRANRGAVIHSIDKSKPHSDHARTVVNRFRRGMYSGSVDFHVAHPSEWLTQAMKEREGHPFLTAALLDLPETLQQVDAAAAALLPDGILGMFCPSITQIGAVVGHMRKAGTPVVMDRVVEFPGGSVGAGLRRWDVRFARVRSRAEAALSVKDAENRLNDVEVKELDKEAVSDSEFEMVCRPLAGERIRGGGFFAIFRKMQHDISEVEQKPETEREASIGTETKTGDEAEKDSEET